MKRTNPHIGSNVLEHLAEMTRDDPELQRLYEASRPRFESVSTMMGARPAAGLAQKELAERMGVGVQVVWRLESLDHSPRLDTLQGAAEALDWELEVKFVPRKRACTARVAEESASYSTRGRKK
ncbi:MAG: XRE family transcriptional regulator [Dehalococcoidia bacterium]|nr:XRE family transcriptional regulator [Dehalococcoidia bacterium]